MSSLPPPSTNSDFLELTSLFRQGRAASYPVASFDGVERSWEDFVREVSGWRERFAAHDATRFALFHSDTWSFAAALFGGWVAGKQLLLPGDTQPATLAALAPEVDGLAGEFPSDIGKLRLAQATPSSRLVPTQPLDAARPSLTVLTSGSTGQPTPFPKRLSQLSEEVRAQEATFGARLGKARVLATVSHQHIYGLLFRVLWPLCAGRVFEVRQLYFPEEIIAHGERTQSALATSPAHLKRLPEQLAWHALRPRLRAVFSSGGPLAFESATLCHARLGQHPIEVYGSSETGGVAYRERSSEHAAWTPLPRVEVDLEPEEGVLRVRSPHLWDSAWLSTSDRAKLVEGGTFELLGRKDRIVKIEEKRVSLQAIEASLQGSAYVQEARAVVLEGARTEIAAVIVLSAAGAELLQKSSKLTLNQALRDAASGRVERIGLPRKFRYVDAFPVNQQGKTSETMLRSLFTEGGE